jgi:hypothetical protein
VPATLTACIVARDEENRLPQCLATLGFCDEIVVVDSGSSDRTREIARQAGAKVIENPWPGFAIQRNVALDHAGGTWILEIDADERVSPLLASEIRALIDESPAGLNMAAIPIRNQFLGGPLGPSARYPGYRHRLFRRTEFRHDESRSVHEGLWPDGPTRALEGELGHVLASSWGEALADARAYARLESTQRARPGGRELAIGVAIRPLVKFLYRTFLYGGWRDGWRGLTKIGLDCATDSLTQIYARSKGAGGASGFGQEQPRVGPVRIVGIALSKRAAARLAGWLEEATRAGADVALISTRPAPDGKVVNRELRRGSVGALIRALDAEDQVRPIDALLPAGRRERLLLRFAPRTLRGAVEPIDPGLAPTAATADLQRRARAE